MGFVFTTALGEVTVAGSSGEQPSKSTMYANIVITDRWLVFTNNNYNC